MRNLTHSEIETLVAAGNSADSWQSVLVGENFSTEKIRNCRFGGRIEIEADVTLIGSTIINYHICRGAKVVDTTRLECRHASKFGNGVKVAVVNENGGRSVAIYDGLTAQCAYIMAMYRHRKALIDDMLIRVYNAAEAQFGYMGVVGEDSTILAARFVREVKVGKGVTIEGASLIENATLLDGAFVGVDVKAVDFIAAEWSKIDRGATLERVFVGENVVVSNGFTAVDSLFFASSHFENGEACSIFAGPYTVSHHKSSLLIAGIFSFFNAGSGTNQSNHLFKSGAIHQSVHRRGCKFGSNGYVMSPAAEGEFTTVIGRHTKHHDTSALPFSYLIENNGVSYLLPGFALRSYGTVRDVEKWQQRDKRAVKRDIVSYNEYNPLLAGKALESIEILKDLLAANPDAEELSYNNTTIKRRMAAWGVELYQLYVTAALGAMVKCSAEGCDYGAGRWVDMAGQYVDKSLLDNLLDNFTTLESLNSSLREFAASYDSAAALWARTKLSELLKREVTDDDIKVAIAAADSAHSRLREMTTADAAADVSQRMSIGYGIDSNTTSEIYADFAAVQGL